MDPASIAVEVIIAIISLVASIGASEQQMRGQEARSSRETFVRQMYQAIKNRFGLSIDELNNAADKLGIKLQQLTDNTRGSARLATASKIYREFIRNYPEEIDAINQAKKIIQNEINRLDSQENVAASKIQNREEVKNSDVLRDAVGSISNVNTAISGFNSTNQIDTGLVDKQIKNDNTEQSAKESNQKNPIIEAYEKTHGSGTIDPSTLKVR